MVPVTSSAVRAARLRVQLRRAADARLHRRGAELGWAYNGADQIELGWKGTPRFEYEYVFGRNDQNGQSVVQSYTVPGTYGRHFVERDQLGTPLGFRARPGAPSTTTSTCSTGWARWSP
ncbi:hypothetical protein NKG94_30450 [Micromonospora sp. M12]